MFWDAFASVKQELMMASVLSLASVDHDKAKEALKIAPQVVKVVVQLLYYLNPSLPSLHQLWVPS